MIFTDRKNTYRSDMDGRAVFKWAVRLVDDTVREVLRLAHITSDELALVIPGSADQQANSGPGGRTQTYLADSPRPLVRRFT